MKTFTQHILEDGGTTGGTAAPANAAGGGGIAGMGVGPRGEPGVPKKKKKVVLYDLIRRTVPK